MTGSETLDIPRQVDAITREVSDGDVIEVLFSR